MLTKLSTPARATPSKNGVHTPALSDPSFDWVTPRSLVMTISPEDARFILAERNSHNRRMKRNLCERIASEISEGRWKVNGETIVFSSDGHLHDGQHRLTGCVIANVPLASWVVFGMQPDTFDSLDRGAPRHTADDLSILGEKSTTNLAAALALVHQEEQGCLDQISKRPIPTRVLLGILERHPDIRHYSTWVASHKAIKKILLPRISTFLYYRFAQIDAEAAGQFFEDLMSGASLAANDPVLLLRNRLLQDKSSKSRLPPAEILAIAIKAWNFRRSGMATRVLRWRSNPNGPAPEPFPAIK
jgi:hypothetical protein